MAEDPTVLSAMDAARVLAPLLVTPDDYLEQYRREVLGEDAEVPIDRLLAARELTFEVARLLKSKDPADWKRLDDGVTAVKAADASTASEVPDTRIDPPSEISVSAEPAPSPVAPPAPVHGKITSPPMSAPTRVSAQASPWAHSATSATPPPPREPPAQPSAAPGPPSSLSKPIDTASLGEESPLAGAELPFMTASNSAPPPVASEVADESMAGETMGIGQMSPLAALASMASTVTSNGTPPKGSVSVDLTLEQYASLCATLEVHPERRASTLETYGILADAAFHSLERSWASKIAGDVALEKRFNELVAHYRGWIRSNG